MRNCPICGNSAFVPAINGRTNKVCPPRCTRCYSLERHRIFRQIFLEIYPDQKALKELTCLHFASDPSVFNQWFHSYTISTYQSPNSIDLQVESDQYPKYDIVIAVHLLEHLADDALGLSILMNHLEPGGRLFLMIPLDQQAAKTKDWGFPDPNISNHYRIYGQDFVQRLDASGQYLVAQFTEQDIITGACAPVFVLQWK